MTQLTHRTFFFPSISQFFGLLALNPTNSNTLEACHFSAARPLSQTQNCLFNRLAQARTSMKCGFIINLLTLIVLSGCQPISLAQLKSAPPEPDFGPHVIVFNPSSSAQDIQRTLDSLYQQQEQNQFGMQRYALLFKPGQYQTQLKLGFYTQAIGLGAHPDDVQLKGDLHVDAQWRGGDATQNFWRSIENLAVRPTDGQVTWAVSQAAPMRCVHIQGNMVLDDQGGWGSGGFIADSLIDQEINSGIQQQWLTRNTHMGQWKSGNWNMVFVGVNNPPPHTQWPKTPYSIVPQTPVHREKPYLTLTQDGHYQVIVPALQTNSQGISWNMTSTRDTALPLTQFYIARPEKDNAVTLNQALNAGQHLLFTPGIYTLHQALHVTRPNTVLLGLGLATLQSTHGQAVIQVDDVDGVKLAGLLIDAGVENSPVLVQIGPKHSHRSRTHNPTTLHDLFIRVGGTGPAQATVSLEINSHDVIGDNLWLWRADHGEGVGWDKNTTQHGLVVNGDRVTVYGLAVEHYHHYQTLWNGNHGRVYFYQSEAPYEVPHQEAWQHNGQNGYASYKIADHVDHHFAMGLGIYCYFNDNPSVKLGSGIEAPEKSGIELQDITTVSLGGIGEITHVLNQHGDKADKTSNVARLKSNHVPQ